MCVKLYISFLFLPCDQFFLYLEDKEHGRQHPKLDDLFLLVLFCLFVLYLLLGTIFGFLTFSSCKLVISYSNFDGLLVLRHGSSPSFSLTCILLFTLYLGEINNKLVGYWLGTNTDSLPRASFTGSQEAKGYK